MEQFLGQKRAESGTVGERTLAESGENPNNRADLPAYQSALVVFKSSAAVFLNEDAESSQKRGLAGAASAAAAVGALMSSTGVISGAVRRNERRGRRFWTFLCLERQKKKQD